MRAASVHIPKTQSKRRVIIESDESESEFEGTFGLENDSSLNLL